MRQIGIAVILFCFLSALTPNTKIVAEGKSERVIFQDDFESGAKRWEMLDPKTWGMLQHDGNQTLEITQRSSEYKPPVRSPGHVALIKGLELANVDIRFRVRSTKDTGNHRDCCES